MSCRAWSQDSPRSEIRSASASAPAPSRGRDPLEQRPDEVAADRAEHVGDLRGRHLARPEGDGLVGEAQAVAHAARRGARQQRERRLLEGDALGLEHALEVARERLRRAAPSG